MVKSVHMDLSPISNLILQVAIDEAHKGDISLLPLMCGTGKSTAISEIIGRTIQEANATGEGLLVITDRISRLNDYLAPRDKKLSLFLKNHREQIQIITQENIKDAGRTHRFYPVLMMTTQRYMCLDKESIEEYAQWKNGKRTLTIIDERPNLLTEVELNDMRFSECEAALREMHIRDEFVRGWHDCLLDINSLLNLIPRAPGGAFGTVIEKSVGEQAANSVCKSAQFFCRPALPMYAFEEKDGYDRIMNVYREYQSRLPAINIFQPQSGAINMTQRLTGLFHMTKCLALYSRYQKSFYQDRPVYATSFSTLLDHYHVLKNTPSKVIILDGTGDLSPEYLMHPFDKRDTSAYRRSLEHLTIRIINYPTSREALSNPQAQGKLISTINAYIESLGIRNSPMALFTYMFLEGQFKNVMDSESVEHLGDIVGKNKFNKATNIIQIGINRFPDYVYLLHFLAYQPEQQWQFGNVLALESALSSTDAEDEDNGCASFIDETNVVKEMMKQSEMIKNLLSDHNSIVTEIRSNFMLAELEQNIFRGIIRNSDSNENYMKRRVIVTYDKLWDLLDERGLTKKQLRIMAGLTPRAMEMLENGENIRWDVIDRICSTLNCMPTDISKSLL